MSRFAAAVVAVFAALTVVVIAVTPVQGAFVTPRMAADTLERGVVRLVRDDRQICTAFKVAPAIYATAKHCATEDPVNDRVQVGRSLYLVTSYITPTDANPGDDWALLTIGFNNVNVGQLGIGCDEEIYIGMPVAYAGYPSPLQFTSSSGQVISITPPLLPGVDADIIMSQRAAGGASGSPVISMNTGYVIGILIETIGTRRGGSYATGVEVISNTSLCRKVATVVNKLP